MNKEEAWQLLRDSSKKAYHFSIILPIIFAVMGVTVILGGILIPKTLEGSYRFFYYGCAIGFSVMFIFYMVNWFHCLKFLKRFKQLEIKDQKLKRLLVLNKVSCIIFMIPVTFFLGLVGFQKVKVFSEGTFNAGTLDAIIYKYLISRDNE
ncbi:hypothetical protein [Lentibacillus daqui]|uniref:hypothetical protein n=1 Tax=Lentibacillus daqui TaxID=2911514 RepID=UPI0022B184EB|nr:hypothetical protein [Lentibacillus daqui]